MKKGLMALAAMGIVLVLTGCGTETLTCTMSQDESGMKMNQKAVVTFEDNEVTKMKMDVEVEVDEAYANYISMMESMLESQFTQFSDNGAKVDVSSSDSKINVSIDMDVKKMTDEQKENLDMEDVYGSKDATKKALEEQGYTCK